MTIDTLAAIAGSLLGLYAVGIVIGLTWPHRQRDPQDGMAIGCLMITLIGLAAVGGVLLLAWWQEWTWLVRALFYAAAFPAISLIGSVIWTTIKKLRTRS